MNDQPRKTLRTLIVQHGDVLLSDRARCRGLLNDLCGAHQVEIRVLLQAHEAGVPAGLKGAAPLPLLVAYLIERLHRDHSVVEAAAQWAVETWAFALGLTVPPPAPKPTPPPAPKLTPPPAPKPLAQPVPRPQRKRRNETYKVSDDPFEAFNK